MAKKKEEKEEIEKLEKAKDTIKKSSKETHKNNIDIKPEDEKIKNEKVNNILKKAKEKGKLLMVI